MTEVLPSRSDAAADPIDEVGATVVDVPGLWSPQRRGLTVGLILTITLVAFESLAVATVMPDVKDDIGGLGLYGWVFSGFFLASILGIVVSGQLADRRGLVLPFSIGLLIFAVGLVIGGAAGSMPVLILGRVLQGLGAGAIPAIGYAAIGRGYPASLRPRMFATLSSAWVVPGLVGPGIATLVEHALSWRWVFLGLIPIVALAATTAIPALRDVGGGVPDDDGDDPSTGTDHLAVTATDPVDVHEVAALAERPLVDPVLAEVQTDAVPDGDASAGEPEVQPAVDRQRLVRVLLLVLGVGAVMGAGTGAPLPLAVALVVVGLPVASWAFVGLVPPGTVRLRPGVPATVAVRGILTATFFAADAYVPLAVVDGRGAPTWVAGLALTATSLTWTAAAWTQSRLIGTWGPRRLDRIGFLTIAVGVGLMLGVSQGLPVGLAVVAWGIAGFGIGLAYPALSVTVLASARPGEEGAASAALQLSDTLGIAVGTGIAGWLVATGDHRGWEVSSGTTAVYGFALLVCLGGLLAAGRLPTRVPDQAE